MTIITIVLILIFAFLAGMESILDQFQFHQPIIACTLIGLACGNIEKGIILGATLQLIALGWMNIGAAVAPDAALASVVSAILVCGPTNMDVTQGIALAIPLSIAGLALTTIVRTITVFLVHIADKYANTGNFSGLTAIHFLCLLLQGLRVTIVAAAVLMIPAEQITTALQSLPEVVTSGLSIGGGMIVVVGYAMVVNMMASAEVWPFFLLGFALSVLTDLNLISMGIIGLVLALVYLQLSPKFNGSANAGGGTISANSSDVVDAILEDYK
jgi:PTS system mannose-specific IIC component